MQIYILQYRKGSIGRLISMDVDIYDTIKTVKKTIKSIYGIPVYKQALFLDDKPLCNQFMRNGLVAVVSNLLHCLN